MHLIRMARLLLLSEQPDLGNRGRLTRSLVTTSMVLMSHHDAIPGKYTEWNDMVVASDATRNEECTGYLQLHGDSNTETTS